MTALFSERGPSRLWLLLTPVATVAMIVTQATLVGGASDWWLWVIIALPVQLFVWLQASAGRTHVSVELTPESLRCGEESVPVAEIAEILPGKAPDHPKRAAPEDFPPWMSARTMGRLPQPPRRRYGVGLRTVDGSTLQAWARNDYALRAALEPLLTK